MSVDNKPISAPSSVEENIINAPITIKQTVINAPVTLGVKGSRGEKGDKGDVIDVNAITLERLAEVEATVEELEKDDGVVNGFEPVDFFEITLNG